MRHFDRSHLDVLILEDDALGRDIVGLHKRGGRNDNERDVLANCYGSCLAIASERRFREIAFPAISTGVYGFPREEAAYIAVASVSAHLAQHELPEKVVFVCFDEPTVEAYRRALG